MAGDPASGRLSGPSIVTIAGRFPNKPVPFQASGNPLSSLMQRGVISSVLSRPETQLLRRGQLRYWYRSAFLQRQMPKARRLAMHARASTDDDLLPRLSQQERLFSNLDDSMKHETGSLYGSVTLIAGARRWLEHHILGGIQQLCTHSCMYKDETGTY